MVQYKLWCAKTAGIGIFIGISPEEIQILIPFVQILVGRGVSARGFYIFGKEF